MHFWKGRYGHRARLGPLALAALSILIALWAQSLAQGPTPLDALILFVVAGLLLARASYVLEPDGGVAAAEAMPAATPRNRLGNALLLGGLAVNLLALALFRDSSSAGRPWLLYLPSLGLGLTGLAISSRQPGRDAAGRSGATRALAILALIVLAAAFFRLYRLDVQPAGLFYDEAMYGLDAGLVAAGQAYPVYFDANYGRGALFIYLIAPFIKLAGADAFTLRLVPALIGILTIPALYVFVKVLFGQRAALIGAALLAMSRWHVNFSRTAFDAILLPLLELLFFYFLIKALRRRRATDFLWAGVVGGLGLNSYVAFRLVPLIAALYVAAHVIRQRRLDRRLLAGLGTLLLALFLVSSPFLQYYVQNPQAVNNRLQTASVVSGRSVEAVARAVVENARKHMLMFNVQGDRNGRHNLPGEPMLDFIAAALFAGGLVYCLCRLRRPPHAFLLLWFLAMLSAGILSVDFEAPQALRSIGAIPAAIVFATLALDRLLAAAERHVAVLRWGAYLGAIGLVIIAGYLNFQNYFVRQANDFASWNDFSTGEALAAKEMKSLGTEWRFYVSSLYVDHPTLRFLAPEIKDTHRIVASEHLPVHDAGDKDVALLLDPQMTGLFAEAKRYYPGAVFKQLGPPFAAPPSLLEVRLRRQDILGAQGLAARYYQGVDWTGPPLSRRDPAISFDWSIERPLRPPFSVEWTGVLYAAEYGPASLGIDSPGAVEVWIDESRVLEANGQEQTLQLAKGNHSLRVRAVVTEATGRTELYGRSPLGDRMSSQGNRQPAEVSKIVVPRGVLFAPPVSNNGLLGSYYANATWSGEPALRQIDPTVSIYFHVTPLPRPYSVEWRGKVEAAVAGIYAFGLESIDDSWLEVDGKPVVEAHVPNRLEERKLTLTRGWHDIRLRYLDRSGWSHVNLFWTPPGGAREVIPAERLLPPQQTYPESKLAAAVPAPSTAGAGLKPASSAATPLLSFGKPGDRPGELLQPKDVASVPGGVYVADTGNGRVQRFDTNGKLVAQIGGRGNAPGQLSAPLAIALAPDGDLLVLDEDTGYVSRFASDGSYKGRIAGPSAGFYHPRGLAAGQDGTIYVADTGSARIVAYAPDGRKLRDLGGKGSGPGKLLGPVGIAVDGEGMLWVVDVDNHRVQRLSPQGEYMGSFDIPAGESVDGAHLVLGPDYLYLTDPAGGKIMTYSFDGRPLAEWGERGSGAGQLARPVGIALDEQGRIWVADRDNNRIQGFQPPS